MEGEGGVQEASTVDYCFLKGLGGGKGVDFARVLRGQRLLVPRSQRDFVMKNQFARQRAPLTTQCQQMHVSCKP